MSRRDIGVALGLPEPCTSELQGWRERLGDPGARQIPPHVTLLPPTTVRTDDLSEVEEHLRSVARGATPYTLLLQGTGTFRPVSPVVFVVVRSGAVECAQLAAAVRSGPLAREVHFAYHPHVTVAHDLPPDALDRAETALADWSCTVRVWGLTLFERGRDDVWRPQRDFPFGTAEVGPAPPG